jgi:hypothetical protein
MARPEAANHSPLKWELLGDKRMKNFTMFACLSIAAFAPQVKAQDGCLDGLLHGQYSFVVSGTLNGAPFAAAGQTIYDGVGNAQGVIQASSNGTIFPATSWTATYSLKSMSTTPTPGGPTVCVLNKTITIPAYNNLQVSFFGTASGDYAELRFIATTPTSTLSGTAKKL